MKDNEIIEYIQETPSLNWAFLVCIELMLDVSYII